MFQNFVSIGGWNIVVTICNTLITFLIVKKFLFKPVRKMLAARAEEVQAMYDQAESDRAEAAAMKKDYTESIANAKAEATQITQTATRRATVRSEEILAEASRQATDMKRKAEQSIEQERKKAMNEIKDEIAGLSVMIASKIVEKDISEEDHKRMIEDFIDKVG
ncbi:MAG: F0F1 ATP synthase subunit B [Clostridiaceae bacterium]|nr:F0F1 ATP synthase subunit B [Butyricicoccus pullicaecorum]MBS7224716.1 F0F1 ATP synthase subunit B [Clostridiaceae bacterium]